MSAPSMKPPIAHADFLPQLTIDLLHLGLLRYF